MALTTRSMKPVRVENVVMPSVDMVPSMLERQIFRHDMDVLVYLSEMKETVNCGHGKGPDYWSGQQKCGNTSKCYVCAGVQNVKKLTECMTEEVKAGAEGLNQVVQTFWAQGM